MSVHFLVLMILLLTPSLLLASEVDECSECHRQQVEQWQGSQHALAMQPVSAASVLGDFDQARLVSTDVEARFYRQQDRFMVRLTEAGKVREWQVRYTFGVYPLQQYLIDIGDGKLQALNIAWDSRRREAGGQRWFRLDDPEHQRPGDALHWRGVYQNWNGMCADCHSTGVRKGYQPDQDRYATEFAEPHVSCSACHEHAGEHAAAARQNRQVSAGADLRKRGSWLPGTPEHTPRHTGPASSAAQVQTCGRCHALRTRMGDRGTGMHDQYSLTRLSEPLYFADGRIREEVFVLGSFLQSRMHQAGVVCSNCHDPHSARPVAEGNALCSQCHQASRFDRVEHHRHPPGSAGSQCVSCHMPERTYMQVDPRREHSFTTPNPQAAQQAGSPDPCLACHDHQSRQWAIEQVAQGWPEHEERDQWLTIQQGSLPAMTAFLADADVAPLYRASLLEQQAEALARTAPDTLLVQLQADSPLVRESAWKAAARLPVDRLRPLAEPGLADASLAVRLAAFEALAAANAVPVGHDAVRVEYERYLEQQSDRPAGRVLRARYRIWSGQVAAAEADLRKATGMDRGYVPAYILLSDLLRAEQRLQEAESLLGQGIEASDGNASLLHLRGLTRLQLRRIPAALEDLGAAWNAAPENADFGYRYALALYHTGHRDRALRLIDRLLTRFPGHPHIAQLERLRP